MESYDRALAINPDLFVTMSNRANTLQELLHLDEAMAAHDRVVATWPDYVSGHWNRAQGRMLQDDWAGGLAEFEWRKRRPEVKDDYPPGPEWTGSEDLAGKTLLIHAEMLLGDTIHFLRYAALAAGARRPRGAGGASRRWCGCWRKAWCPRPRWRWWPRAMRCLPSTTRSPA